MRCFNRRCNRPVDSMLFVIQPQAGPFCNEVFCSLGCLRAVIVQRGVQEAAPELVAVTD